MLKTIGALVALFMAVIGSLPALAQDPVTLSVLYSGAYVNRAPMEQLSAQFEASHPGVKIKLEDVKGYTEMTQLMLRTAVTGDMPDVGFQGLSFVRLFAERKLALPLDEFIAKEPSWTALGYSESVMNTARQGQATYGIPFEISVPTIYFNASLVTEAGGDPDLLPTTWPEIVSLARKIKAKSGAIYFDYTPTANWTFIALVESQGGRMIADDDRTVAFDGKEGLQALQILKSIGEAGMTDMTRDQAKQAFAEGSLGILVTSSSDITLYTKQAGGRFDIRVVPFPVSEGGLLPAGGNAVMIHTKDPAKQRAAWQYVKFMTGPDAQTTMAKLTSYMPVNDLAISDPKYLQTYYQDQPNLLVPVKQLPVVTSWFSFPGRNSLKVTPVIENSMRDVLILNKPPKTVLTDMANDVQQLLD